MAVNSLDVYRWLTSGTRGPICESFDVHIVACALSVAVAETEHGGSLVDAAGLDQPELCELARMMFPHAESVFQRIPAEPSVSRAADEACLQELLYRGSTEASRLQYMLACLVARRAQRPNHLWQDLGLRNRRELSWLMQRHFESVAARNKQDMKWKKFLYRMICRDEGFGFCTAPSCEECSDYQGCFGEDGLSLLETDAPSSGRGPTT